jgi:hypothetical protein
LYATSFREAVPCSVPDQWIRPSDENNDGKLTDTAAERRDRWHWLWTCWYAVKVTLMVSASAAAASACYTDLGTAP